MTEKSIDAALHRLANMIIIASGSNHRANNGLLRGKLGVAIFLLHYARYYDIEKYESYANHSLHIEALNRLIELTRHCISRMFRYAIL